MATNLNVRSLLLTVFGLFSFIATLGSSAPLAPAQASQTTNDIAVTMSENHTTLMPGGRVTFTVSMTNRGPDNASFVDVGFVLPAQLRLVSMKCDLGISPDSPFCEYSSLPKGATVVSKLVAAIKSGVRQHAGLVKISASASFENTGVLDPDLSNNTDSVRLRLISRAAAP